LSAPSPDAEVDQGVDCALLCPEPPDPPVDVDRNPVLLGLRRLEPLMKFRLNNKGRNTGALITIITTVHSTIFQMRRLSRDVGATRTRANRAISIAMMNSARVKTPMTAIFCDILIRRWITIESGRAITFVRLAKGEGTDEICDDAGDK
jgi:hypothetical protein